MTEAAPLQGVPLEAAGLVAYQEGAIVSRTVPMSGTGSVTVFAFDAGQRLSEHTVSYDALVLVLEGSAEIVVAGMARRVGAGSLIVMPGGRPHAVRAVERFKMLLVLPRG